MSGPGEPSPKESERLGIHAMRPQSQVAEARCSSICKTPRVGTMTPMKGR